MLYAAKAMGNMSVRLMNDSDLVSAAKEEFKNKLKGVRYKSPLPDHWKPGM